MSLEMLELDKALELGGRLPYVYLREESRLYLGAGPIDLNLNELIEARFFSEEKEIRLFRRMGKLCAAIQEDGNKPAVTHRYSIANPAFGGELTTRQLISYDTDGQAYLGSPRLAGWKGAN